MFPKVIDFNNRIANLDWYDPFDTKEAGYITPQDNGESTELTKQDQVHIDNIMACEAQIKNLKASIEEAKKGIMMSMKDAKEHIERVGISDLPITQSKEYVKIMLNSLIKEAAILGTDSIGITNGQIQADRYEGQGDEESEGATAAKSEFVMDEKLSNKTMSPC